MKSIFLKIVLGMIFLISILCGQNNDHLSDYDLINKYKELIELNNKDAASHFKLGLVYLRLEMYSEAKITFQKLKQLRPGDAEPCFYLGIIFEALKNYEMAISSYKEAIEKDSEYAASYLSLGILNGNISRFDKSIYYLNKYIDLKPDDDSGYEFLGMAYLINDNYALAISPFKKAIVLNPNNLNAVYNLYLSYKAIGNKDEAISTLKRVIYLDPYNKDYHSELKNLEGNKDQVEFYTQVVSDICHINFPKKPTDMSDIPNKSFVYRFFDPKDPIIYILETEYVGHYEYFNEPKKDVLIRIFLSEYLKKTYPAKSIADAEMFDYETDIISFPGIKQKFSLTENFNGRKLDQISDVWFIYHKNKKTIIMLFVTRFLYNYEEKENSVMEFFESLKVYP